MGGRRGESFRGETVHRGAPPGRPAPAVRPTASLATGHYRHDLAWLSSSRPFQLLLKEGGRQADGPLSTSTMRSPVVVGLKPEVAQRLRKATPDGQLSWADLADAAAAGTLKYAMADPRSSNSGLAALVGVATAAAGTGGALRPEDISCDRLRGFFAGHVVTEDSSGRLADAYARNQDGLDALVTYESELLSLNRAGTLRTPLEVVYPKDGIVLSDYPLMLLDPAKRAAYDRLTAWLRSEPVQRKIMERTLRRPVDPGLTRVPGLRAPLGSALYFPDSQAVVDRLLADYADARSGRPVRVIFLLDFSTSMRGERIANLRATMDGLSGADGSPSGKFTRFHQGETLTVVRFGGRVLDEHSVTYTGAADLERLRGMVADDTFDASTAVWSALDHGYRTAADAVADPRAARLHRAHDGRGEQRRDEPRRLPRPVCGPAVGGPRGPHVHRPVRRGRSAGTRPGRQGHRRAHGRCHRAVPSQCLQGDPWVSRVKRGGPCGGPGCCCGRPPGRASRRSWRWRCCACSAPGGPPPRTSRTASASTCTTRRSWTTTRWTGTRPPCARRWNSAPATARTAPSARRSSASAPTAAARRTPRSSAATRAGSTVFLAPYGDPADPSRGPRVRITCATEGLRNQVPRGTFLARCLGKVQEWNPEEGVLEVQAMAIFR
nr:substrate-binding and VWA domain-containing protein [Streptomyces sp. NBC_01001]